MIIYHYLYWTHPSQAPQLLLFEYANSHNRSFVRWVCKLRSSWFYNFCSPLLQIQLQTTHSVLNHVYGINSLFHFSSLTQTVLLLIHLISLKTDCHFLSTHQSHHLSLPSLFLLLEQNSPVSPILPITDNWFPAKLLSYRLLCVDLFYLFHFVNFLLWFHAVYKAGCPEVFLSYGWPV